jgi:hypothetical protein
MCIIVINNKQYPITVVLDQTILLGGSTPSLHCRGRPSIPPQARTPYHQTHKAILEFIFGAVAESQRRCIGCPIFDTVSVPIYPTIQKAIYNAHR